MVVHPGGMVGHPADNYSKNNSLISSICIGRAFTPTSMAGHVCFIKGSKMKRWVRCGGAICISSILLTSCTIGNGHICGPQTPLIYCDSGANERVINRKKYMEWWGKTNLSTDQRSKDWVACGGYSGGDYGPPLDQLRQEKRPDEVGESAAYERLSHEFQRCMLKNGYYYMGNCNSKAMRLEPMCVDTKIPFFRNV